MTTIHLLAVRLLHSVLTLWLVTVLFFIVIEALPGDFAVQSAGMGTTEEMMQATRQELGLLTSAPVRYLKWLGGALTGDLGISWWARQPIATMIGERLWHSFWLFGWASVITIPLSLLLALLATYWQHTWFDRATSMTSLAVMSVPEFIVAYMVMNLFAVQLGIFPAYTMYAIDMPWTERLYATILPVASLVAVTVTPMFRLIRAVLVRVMGNEYVEMAVIKGLTRRRILLHHALPNTVGPVANAMALGMANLFIGLVVIEVIYSYPGLGKLMVTAAVLHDVPLVQACALIAATLYITFNLLADVAAILANPKLRYPSS